MNVTYYWANKLVDFHFRAAALAKPTAWWFGLFTVMPNNLPASGTEVVGGSYARVNLAPSDTNYAATQGGTVGNSSGTTKQTTNVPIITFPTPTADWGTIVGYGLFDAATVGNLCFYNPLTTTGPFVIGTVTAIKAGDTPIYIDVGGFLFKIGD